MNTQWLRRWPALSLAICAATLVACGGGGGGGAPEQPTRQLPANALRPAQSGELAAYFKDRIAKRSAQGIDGTMARDVMLTVAVTAQADGAGAPGQGGMAGTQIQEAGVDEDDLIKSDGEHIYALHPRSELPARLATSRIQANGNLTSVGQVELDNDFLHSGMYLASDANRIAVIGERSYFYNMAADLLLPYPQLARQLSVQLMDTSGAQPAPAGRVLIDGDLISTRMIGNVLYIASTWTPDLSIYPIPANLQKSDVEARLSGLTSGQLLPTIRVNGAAAQPLVNESECLLQPNNASLNLQLTTITAIDLASPTLARSSRCMVGDSSALYMSPTSVYLATSRDMWIASVTAQAILPLQVTTDIHKFSLQGLGIDYRGSGEVAGHLGWDREKMPYRMSEHNGDLRVLTFTGSVGWGMPVVLMATANTATATAAPLPPASPATLTVLREDAAEVKLVKVGSLPNAQRPAPIGKEGEQVYAVHFAGPQAYVVTFRRVDPLYILDLSNPADPKTVGELTVPGYSDYLYPLGNGRLLGVGRAASDAGFVQGLQVSLFDVSNPAQPSLLASRKVGDVGSSSTLDYSRHGINILNSGNQVRIALPTLLSQKVEGGAFASWTNAKGLSRFTVDLAAGTLTERPLSVAPVQDWNIATERALQSANSTYYMTGGQVIRLAEP